MVATFRNQIRDALDRATRAADEAAQTHDPEVKAHYLEMKRNWLKLLSSYEMSERFELFSLELEKRRHADLDRDNRIYLYRPLCSACGTLTALRCIEPALEPGHDLRTFECAKCGQSEVVKIRL